MIKGSFLRTSLHGGLFFERNCLGSVFYRTLGTALMTILVGQMADITVDGTNVTVVRVYDPQLRYLNPGNEVGPSPQPRNTPEPQQVPAVFI